MHAFRVMRIVHRHYVPEKHLSTGLSNGTRLFSVRYELDIYIYICIYIYCSMHHNILLEITNRCNCTQ